MKFANSSSLPSQKLSLPTQNSPNCSPSGLDPPRKIQKLRFVHTDLIAFYKLMTHMHNLSRFSFYGTEYVIFTGIKGLNLSVDFE